MSVSRQFLAPQLSWSLNVCALGLQDQRAQGEHVRSEELSPVTTSSAFNIEPLWYSLLYFMGQVQESNGIRYTRKFMVHVLCGLDCTIIYRYRRKFPAIFCPIKRQNNNFGTQYNRLPFEEILIDCSTCLKGVQTNIEFGNQQEEKIKNWSKVDHSVPDARHNGTEPELTSLNHSFPVDFYTFFPRLQSSMTFFPPPNQSIVMHCRILWTELRFI